MTNKKMQKTYFGIPKTPIDDNTVFYASLDGTTEAEVGGIPFSYTAPNPKFKNSPTGLGLNLSDKVNSNSESGYLSYLVPKLSLKDNFTIDLLINGEINPAKFPSGTNYVERIFTLTGNELIGQGNVYADCILFKDNISVRLFNSTHASTPISMSKKLSELKLNSINHIRVVFTTAGDITAINFYINGVLISSKSTDYSTSAFINNTGQVYLNIGSLGNNQSQYLLTNIISDVSISNIDRGDYFPTLPQDFIDGKASIALAFNEQRQAYADPLTSERKQEIVKVNGYNQRHLSITQATPGVWTSGDKVKVKGLTGEIITGVLDTDTAIAKVLGYGDEAITSGTTSDTKKIKLNTIEGLALNDEIRICQKFGENPNVKTITEIDTVNNIITLNTAILSNEMDTYYLFETTAGSSSPIVKADIEGTTYTSGTTTTAKLTDAFSSTTDIYKGNVFEIVIDGTTYIREITSYTGLTKTLIFSPSVPTNVPGSTKIIIRKANIQALCSGIGTNEATFTLSANASLIKGDLQLEYSLNELPGQGQTPVYDKELAGEIKGKRLVVNPTVHITDDFKGKISGSTVENPHISKFVANGTLQIPSSVSFSEVSQSYMNSMYLLDTKHCTVSNSANLAIPQTLFSFNLIELVERKYGEIKALDKVQWLKDNINTKCNWYGYGLCPAGNKAYFKYYNVALSTWGSSGIVPSSGNTSSTPTLIYHTSNPSGGANISEMIDSNGFVHYLACTDASDGVIASTIYTDYINIEVTLKTPAGYNVLAPENTSSRESWRVKSEHIKEVNDFSNKIVGSNNECPHVLKQGGLTSLTTLIQIPITGTESDYTLLQVLDGNPKTYQTTTNTNIPQQMFSFNVIELIERKYGKIPSTNKIQWIKDNVAKLTCNWWGYGSCPTGNKAILDFYVYGTVNNWGYKNASTPEAKSNTNATPSLLSIEFLPTNSTATLDKTLGEDGFVHFLAYSNASNGTIASTINTDYINCEIILKESAIRKLSYFNSRISKSNILLVRKETREVQTMFPANNEDGIAVYGNYVPQNPILTTTEEVTVLAELGDFLMYDISTATAHLVDNPIIKTVPYRLNNNDVTLAKDFAYAGLQKAFDTKSMNTGLKIKVGAKGSGEHYLESGVPSLKKNFIGVSAALVNHKGEIKLWVYTKKVSNYVFDLDLQGISMLVPLEERPLVKDEGETINSIALTSNYYGYLTSSAPITIAVNNASVTYKVDVETWGDLGK